MNYFINVVINDMSDCIEYSNRLNDFCKTNKSVSSLRCDKLKEKYLDHCKQQFQNKVQFQEKNKNQTNQTNQINQSSLENNSTCFSDKHLGGNTLKDTIKSPETSGEREKPFPLIIFSSRF